MARNAKLEILWRKQEAHWEKFPPRVPPDDELIRLYTLLAFALRVEYLRCDAARVVPPRETISLNQSGPWFKDCWGELADIQCEISFAVNTQIFPGLGRGVPPDTAKLRAAASQIALSRNRWHLLRARFTHNELPAPFAEFLPHFFRYIDPMGEQIDAWPDAIDRHVQLREANGVWDEESIRTLMVSKAGDNNEFTPHNLRVIAELNRLSNERKPR